MINSAVRWNIQQGMKGEGMCESKIHLTALQITNAQTTEQAPSKMQTLKRRIGYDDDAEGRNVKRDKMVVDESGHVD